MIGTVPKIDTAEGYQLMQI